MIIRQLISSYLATISVYIVCFSSLCTTNAFTGRHYSHRSSCVPKISLYSQAPNLDKSDVSPSAADNAAAMTEFMAKAHEEKVKAMGRVEDKYRGQISDLEEKISELEVLSKQTTPTSGNSFAFPATNKDLTDKVQSYRTFISDYIVKAQEEKATAVKATETKLTAKYEAIIDGLKKEGGN